MTPNQVDTIFLEQKGHALCQLSADFGRAGNQAVWVDRGRQGDQTEAFGVAGAVQDIGALQHHFGWNTAPVKADAAQMGAFD